MITVGSKLNSLSQISRALRNGFVVVAEFVTNRTTESSYSGEISSEEWMMKRCAVRKMTDLNESMYNELAGLRFEEPYSYLNQYGSKVTGDWHWEFFAVID